MKILVLLIVSCLIGFSQTGGTVVTNTTSTVVGTAGNIVCTLTNTSPVLASGFHTSCTISGVIAVTGDSVVPQGTNGSVGSFGISGNIVTWIVNQPTGQTGYSWQMTANGVGKSGVF